MIIAPSLQLIFAAVPKTGTHSVRRVLREHMAPSDLEQVGLFERKSFPFPELAEHRHGHFTLAEVRPFLDPDDFARFFKFGFVRNPYDRFVSFCAFLTRKHGDFARAPREVMHHFLFVDPPEDRILFKPQAPFFIDSDGTMLADYVGRVETMQESFDAVCDRIGIPRTELEVVNQSEHRPYRDYYTPELRDGVAKRYAMDIEMFGYDF